MSTTLHRSRLETPVITAAAARGAVPRSWQERLPVLSGERVTLRQLGSADAAPLCALLTTEDVSRFISTPPCSVAGFERFIAWSERQRAAGVTSCFAATVGASDQAIGIVQVQRLGRSFERAEWGFAIGSSFWGTGVFQEAAELVLRFAFEVVGVRRIEARTALRNGRSTGALVKLGASREALLCGSLHRHGESFDQGLYAIRCEDWRARARAAAPARRDTVRVH
jgi:RimJ/RimL family protein N-acetyltransferase